MKEKRGDLPQQTKYGYRFLTLFFASLALFFSFAIGQAYADTISASGGNTMNTPNLAGISTSLFHSTTYTGAPSPTVGFLAPVDFTIKKVCWSGGPPTGSEIVEYSLYENGVNVFSLGTFSSSTFPTTGSILYCQDLNYDFTAGNYYVWFGSCLVGTTCGSFGETTYIYADSATSSGGGGGSATSSPYIIDVGSTVMLGGILMFLIAYWFVGLIRSRNRS